MEIILNCMPISLERRADFERCAPSAVHRYRTIRELTAEDVMDVTILLGSAPAEIVPHAEKLKWLHSMWAGGNEYLQRGVLPEGVILTTSVGAYGQAVSEHLLAMTLSLLKKLHLYRDQQMLRLWKGRGKVKTIAGSTVLVVGAGDIGGSYASLCKALGAARTIGLRRDAAKGEPGIDEMHPIAMLDYWLPQADIVTLVLPHNEQTAGLMDERRLRLMKNEAILINGGRGSVVPLDGLHRVLRDGALWGAGLDVMEDEPLPSDHPLWGMEQCILTPHVAGGFHLEGTFDRMVEITLENLRRFMNGEELRNRMN